MELIGIHRRRVLVFLRILILSLRDASLVRQVETAISLFMFPGPRDCFKSGREMVPCVLFPRTSSSYPEGRSSNRNPEHRHRHQTASVRPLLCFPSPIPSLRPELTTPLDTAGSCSNALSPFPSLSTTLAIMVNSAKSAVLAVACAASANGFMAPR